MTRIKSRRLELRIDEESLDMLDNLIYWQYGELLDNKRSQVIRDLIEKEYKAKLEEDDSSENSEK